MEALTLERTLPLPSSDWLHLEDPLPDIKIRIKTVQKTCQGPFLPAHKLPRKHSSVNRSTGKGLAEKSMLFPCLHPSFSQTYLEKYLQRKLPKQEVDRKNRMKIGGKTILLRGNSVEIEDKPKSRMCHKHSLSSICQPVTLKAKCENKRNKLVKKNTFTESVPDITFTAADLPPPPKPQKLPLNAALTDKVQKEKACLLKVDDSPGGHKSSKSSGFRESPSEDGVSLTPFHALIDMSSGRKSKAHGYLKRAQTLRTALPKTVWDTFMIKAQGDIGAQCTCLHPLHSRNMWLFALKGFNSLHFPPPSLSIERIMRPLHLPSNRPVVLIHMEGVLFHLHSQDTFSPVPLVCSLRPGVIEGLRFLARHFELVFISNSEAEYMYKLLEYFLQNKVQFSAVYKVKNTKKWGNSEEMVMNYEGIMEDLRGKEPFFKHIAVLAALYSEVNSYDESVLYTKTGLNVSLHARYLPVVTGLKGDEKPIVTFLVPHIGVEENDSVLFTVICREMERIYDEEVGWDEAVLRIHKSKLPLSHLLSTKCVHEVYLSSLLPPLLSDTFSCYHHDFEIGLGGCAVHPRAHTLAANLTENQIVIINSERRLHRGKLENMHLEVDLKKETSLLHFVLGKDEKST